MPRRSRQTRAPAAKRWKRSGGRLVRDAPPAPPVTPAAVAEALPDADAASEARGFELLGAAPRAAVLGPSATPAAPAAPAAPSTGPSLNPFALPEDVVRRIMAYIAAEADPRPALRIAATSRVAPRLIQRACLTHLNTSIVDASRGLDLLRTYARARAQLLSIDISVGEREGLLLLRWLFETCDTSRLERVRVKLFAGTPMALVSAHVLGDGIIDVEHDAFRMPTEEELPQMLAWTPDASSLAVCPSVRSFKLVGNFTWYLGGDSSLAMFAELLELPVLMPNLADMTLSIRMEDRDSNAAFLAQIPQLPNLERLCLMGMGARVTVRSSSVRVIDMRACGKHLWLDRIDCPNLEELHVVDRRYGNGVRRRSSAPADSHDGLKWDEGAVRRFLPGDWNETPVSAKIVPAAGNDWVSPPLFRSPAIPITLPPNTTVH
eukprot:CAMPEP_0119269402 /NCGR_PEP_ID=MMETSP1329-20130426/6830_1 /TAXON_ID=114041 /ORGANISM="Genus nov. species nov., Strain RCC1024" /LENGTH=433 /DNA_ID=CAMNT_0007269401 /DNA_START=67 /DNA_END=1365 /DNA_ORIENTATION=+